MYNNNHCYAVWLMSPSNNPKLSVIFWTKKNTKIWTSHHEWYANGLKSNAWCNSPLQRFSIITSRERKGVIHSSPILHLLKPWHTLFKHIQSLVDSDVCVLIQQTSAWIWLLAGIILLRVALVFLLISLFNVRSSTSFNCILFCINLYISQYYSINIGYVYLYKSKANLVLVWDMDQCKPSYSTPCQLTLALWMELRDKVFQ